MKNHCKKCSGCLREHERDARASGTTKISIEATQGVGAFFLNFRYYRCYFLGEIEQANIFRDPAMLSRFNHIQNLDPENKNHLLSVVDGFIKALKFKNIATL